MATRPPRPARPTAGPAPRHVSLVALPDAAVSTLSGVFDVLNAVGRHGPARGRPRARRRRSGWRSWARRRAPSGWPSGVPITVQRSIAEIEATDIVIVPSVVLRPGGWARGRYPALVDWLRAMHARGAVLCSACSGVFLLAETGLFDGEDATVHFGYARAFAATYPAVPIHPERVLVVSGRHEELVSSGASMAWHDLVLYLIARYARATAAQAVARFFALQWHQDGLAPYIVFEGKRDHGDGDIAGAQRWLDAHFAVANPVEAMVERSRLAERTFKRRFTQATGLSPDRLRPAPASRGREAPAGAHGGAHRGDQLAGGLRGPGRLPAPVQAHHRAGAGRLPQALQPPRLRPPEAPGPLSPRAPERAPRAGTRHRPGAPSAGPCAARAARRVPPSPGCRTASSLPYWRCCGGASATSSSTWGTPAWGTPAWGTPAEAADLRAARAGADHLLLVTGADLLGARRAEEALGGLAAEGIVGAERVSLVRITETELRVVGTDGDHNLGGKDWDDRLIGYLTERLEQDLHADLIGDDFQELLVRAEALKRSLSARESAEIRVEAAGHAVRYEVTRRVFEDLTADLLERTRRLAERVLEDAGLTWSQITGVVPVGGSTRMPMVRRLLETLSGRAPLAGAQPDEAVALGAAFQAILEAKGRQPADAQAYALPAARAVVDVISHSLGMIAASADNSRYVNSILIRKNQPIPTVETRPYRLRLGRSRENSLEVFLTQGESEDPQACAYLGRYVLTGFPADASGPVVVDVRYAYDRSGVVQVGARVRETGTELSLAVGPVPDDVPVQFAGSPAEDEAREHLTVYLAFDLSGSMDGAPLREAKRAARAFVAQVDLTASSVGLISFSRLRPESTSPPVRTRLNSSAPSTDLVSAAPATVTRPTRSRKCTGACKRCPGVGTPSCWQMACGATKVARCSAPGAATRSGSRWWPWASAAPTGVFLHRSPRPPTRASSPNWAI